MIAFKININNVFIVLFSKSPDAGCLAYLSQSFYDQGLFLDDIFQASISSVIFLLNILQFYTFPSDFQTIEHTFSIVFYWHYCTFPSDCPQVTTNILK